MNSYEYAGVHLLDNPYFLDITFDYFIPPDLRGSVHRGDFVTLPFGNANRKRLALVTALKEKPDNGDTKCKPLFSVCPNRMSLSEELLELCAFMKEQTLCTVGDAVRAVIPASAISRLAEVYRAVMSANINNAPDAPTLLICEYIRKRGSVSFDLLKNKFGPTSVSSLKKLCDCGLIVRDFELKDAGEKNEAVCALAISAVDASAVCNGTDKKYRLRSEKHIAVIKALAEGGKMSEAELKTTCGVTTAQIKAVAEKGLITRTAQRVDRADIGTYISEPKEIILNDEQENALRTLTALSQAGEARAALLHGVTGSGKTCVMMKIIDTVLASGRGVIVLLPEIALTPQSLGLFCSRYGERVAVIHSGLSAGERFDTYCKIKDGLCDVVIGTRSAVFAPLKNPGLIIIDEEQEHTYKSDMNPKYHARDIARFRCSYNKALMLLASATPSVESYKKAKDGKYTLITLKKRYGGAELPKTTIADMRPEMQAGNISPLGSLLCRKLCENKSRECQSVLFLNRRGYNNFLSCRSCGEAVKCPVCSVSMTYHTLGSSYDRGELRCHWCGRRMPVPAVCPSCGGEHLVRMGYGTQRVEQELSSLLPDAKILRMDTDSTTSRSSYENMLGSFRRHEADVLLGTQMVTKGHDFPDVTLVGVLLADASLYLDDYRANERTFSMLTQVIGRAGRADKPGEAVIQTNNPDNDCIRLACAQDYETFYEHEIKLRQLLVFPPFCDIVLLTVVSPDERETAKAAKILADKLEKTRKDRFVDVPLLRFGPFEAPVYKVENKYRMRMVVKCRLNKRSRLLFSEILAGFSKSGAKNLTLSVDFNPSNL